MASYAAAMRALASRAPIPTAMDQPRSADLMRENSRHPSFCGSENLQNAAKAPGLELCIHAFAQIEP
jgi:hypothetical protein